MKTQNRKVEVKILIGVFFLFIWGGCSNQVSYDRNKDLYDEIDREINKSSQYEAEKERRIENLKKRIRSENNEERKRELTDWLITEYEAYKSDSALHYININLNNPNVREDKRLETELLIKKADVAAHAGLFQEATEILEGINRQYLDSALFENYYSAYSGLYQYQSEYVTDSEYALNHGRLRELYIDSVSQVSGPNSINYVITHAASESRNGNFKEAEDLLLGNINKYKRGDRTYSILSSILADIYKQQGDKNNYIKFIGESVISDIQGAVKENMAIRALATECFEEGDFERAEKYLRQSFADANFYSARMRNAQSSRILPVVGEAYSSQQKSLNHKLRLLVIFISILAFCFIIVAIFSIFQLKKIRRINSKTRTMLNEVSELSEQLGRVNEELRNTNNKLQDSNRLKGEYAVLFMEYCSLAISSLQQFQQSLKVTAAQGNFQSLVKKINSMTFENQTLAEFYSKFDEAILNLYPSFIEDFNSLLLPEYRVEIKDKDSLNTELRVYALIKLGITDSEKIAKFLRCSISTVYTYRSKTKKKAIDPETFEKSFENL